MTAVFYISVSHRAVAPQFKNKKKTKKQNIPASLLAKARSLVREKFSDQPFPFFTYNEICLFLLERFFSMLIFKSKLSREILPALRVHDPCYLSFLYPGLISSTSTDKSRPATWPTPVHFNLDPFNSTKSVSWPCMLSIFDSVPLCSPLQCPILVYRILKITVLYLLKCHLVLFSHLPSTLQASFALHSLVSQLLLVLSTSSGLL